MVSNPTWPTGQTPTDADPGGLLFAWNQTDTSQFTEEGDAGFAATPTTWGTRFGTPDPDPALLLTNPATSGQARFWLVSDTEIDYATLWDEPFIVEARHANRSPLGTQEMGLLLLYEDPTHWVSTTYAGGATNNPRNVRRDGSTTFNDGWGGLALYTGRTARNEGYFFSPQIQVFTLPSGAANPAFTISTARQQAGLIGQSFGTWNASWQALGSYNPKVGFYLRSYGTATTAVDGNLLSQFRVYRPYR